MKSLTKKKDDSLVSLDDMVIDMSKAREQTFEEVSLTPVIKKYPAEKVALGVYDIKSGVYDFIFDQHTPGDRAKLVQIGNAQADAYVKKLKHILKGTDLEKDIGMGQRWIYSTLFNRHESGIDPRVLQVKEGTGKELIDISKIPLVVDIYDIVHPNVVKTDLIRNIFQVAANVVDEDNIVGREVEYYSDQAKNGAKKLVEDITNKKQSVKRKVEFLSQKDKWFARKATYSIEQKKNSIYTKPAFQVNVYSVDLRYMKANLPTLNYKGLDKR